MNFLLRGNDIFTVRPTLQQSNDLFRIILG